MSRPFKCRRVCAPPESDYYKPRGIPLYVLQEIILTIDEFEAIRLADLEGLYQTDAAKKMDVSRQTFGNIIKSAHKKIADFIVNAKALKIKGGSVKLPERYFNCRKCSNEWIISYKEKPIKKCPKCNSAEIKKTGQDIS